MAKSSAPQRHVSANAERSADQIRTTALIWLGLAALPDLAWLALGFARRWTTDDAFIDFRVVQQLLAGHGPVFNIGQRLEVYTSPLWLGLLALSATAVRVEVAAVALGLLFSVGGLVAAQAGALRLIRQMAAGDSGVGEGMIVPLGAMILVAIPPVWDFATSGLETGLIFGWLGLSFFLLTWVTTGGERCRGYGARWGAMGWRRFAAVIVIGLGPLVRPDLILMSVAFLAALAVESNAALQRQKRRLDWVALFLAAAVIPALYEIFRMGYFAALVPNTALAKEASLANWPHGGAYWGDFVETYALWVPILILGGWVASHLFRLAASGDRTTLAIWLATSVGAAADAVYALRVGGDFMHGRFLLPSLFCGLLPLMLVRLPRVSHPQARLLWVATAVLIAWSGVCAISLRVPYLGKIGPDGIADERGFYVALSGQPNPVTGFDYRDSAPYLAGKTARSALLGVHRVLLIPYGAPDNIGGKPIPLKSAVASQIDVAVTRDTIGVFSYAVGLNTFVVDTLGLADPMGSRLLLVPPRLGRIANEKQLPYYWVVAHYTNSAPPYTDDFVVAARAALSCGDLRELLAAIEEPLTAQRFARNLVLSYRLTALRIPANPADAQSRFCSRP